MARVHVEGRQVRPRRALEGLPSKLAIDQGK